MTPWISGAASSPSPGRVNDRRHVFLEADYRNRIASIRDEWSSLRGHRERKHMAREHALL
jgi:hypothetical protein